MHLKKIIAKSWMFGKVLLVYCGLGGLCGAAIGFFVFLHLGSFKTPEDAGYATGVFIKSGVEFGIFVWALRGVISLLRWKTRHSTKKGL
ncbi:MAG: hypothetical protein ACYDHE_14315 [Candidatus Acidiferrales bacterium]